MKSGDLSASRLAVDVRQSDDLRLKLKQNPREGLKQVAEQFESLFLNMMLKSMRDTLPQDGLFDSDQSRFYTSMLDQQMAQKLSSSGQLGFAKLIEQQMGRFCRRMPIIRRAPLPHLYLQVLPLFRPFRRLRPCVRH